ncbi:3 TM domain-containing transmembrane protein [Acrasis kona]|uniref:3 TM domain-containing transmembrane protein n=1 Tax=Acrasis kona TaxID=1008807 RepID=A0AAW2ZCZ8_9EUKA
MSEAGSDEVKVTLTAAEKRNKLREMRMNAVRNRQLGKNGNDIVQVQQDQEREKKTVAEEEKTMNIPIARKVNRQLSASDLTPSTPLTPIDDVVIPNQRFNQLINRDAVESSIRPHVQFLDDGQVISTPEVAVKTQETSPKTYPTIPLSTPIQQAITNILFALYSAVSSAYPEYIKLPQAPPLVLFLTIQFMLMLPLLSGLFSSENNTQDQIVGDQQPQDSAPGVQKWIDRAIGLLRVYNFFKLVMRNVCLYLFVYMITISYIKFYNTVSN